MSAWCGPLRPPNPSGHSRQLLGPSPWPRNYIVSQEINVRVAIWYRAGCAIEFVAGQPLAFWVKCSAIGVASWPHKPAHALLSVVLHRRRVIKCGANRRPRRGLGIKIESTERRVVAAMASLPRRARTRARSVYAAPGVGITVSAKTLSPFSPGDISQRLWEGRFRLALRPDGKGENGRNKEAQIAAIRALQARTNVVIAIGNRIPLNNFDQWLKELDRITNHVNVHWVGSIAERRCFRPAHG
jgi:hypothetical protein